MGVRARLVDGLRRTVATRMALGVIVLSVLLTASFVGLLGLISSAPLDVGSRLPAYVLVMGIVFVVGIVRLDTPERDGATVLVAVAGLSVLALVLTGLATEGAFYTALRPDQVITSQLILYFGAAGLVCTGVVIWALHHWREFASSAPAE
ncbi:hypothetical protein [Halomicrobium salinisoli]|uniref:hypothetical protein n=1 Tax=Halomicrobium salinisoli TaxID=2878391 RepID=UPI001CEFC7CA|nr:hypothetical protein [Halomicrobium salinisoli]